MLVSETHSHSQHANWINKPINNTSPISKPLRIRAAYGLNKGLLSSFDFNFVCELKFPAVRARAVAALRLSPV